MQITRDIVLYFIRDTEPAVYHEKADSKAYAGIRQMIPGGSLNPAYLYVCSAEDAQQNWAQITQECSLLILNPESAAGLSVEELPGEIITAKQTDSMPAFMNRLNDIYYQLIEWDNDMHIAVLEGADIQKLLDISEPILKFPAISFDGSFDVIAHTKHTEIDYPTYYETIRRGYTDPVTMKKVGHIFDEIKTGAMLVAPSADDNTRFNIYLQFFHQDSLLGYTSIFCGHEPPENGYLELVRLFFENMSFCMRRDFENKRYGRLMYETFLTNLLSKTEFSKEQIREQLLMIDGLSEEGGFLFGILDFFHADNVPLKFLLRMMERQFFDIKLFLYEKRICILKVDRDKTRHASSVLFRPFEEKTLQELFRNYFYVIGISRPFFSILHLRDAYVQADRALFYGLRKEDRKGHLFYYRDYWQYHLLECVSRDLDPGSMVNESYHMLNEYDRANHTMYLKIVMTFIQCGQNATRAAAELGIHRNTVRNRIHFSEELCGISIADLHIRTEFLLSAAIMEYQNPAGIECTLHK